MARHPNEREKRGHFARVKIEGNNRLNESLPAKIEFGEKIRAPPFAAFHLSEFAMPF